MKKKSRTTIMTSLKDRPLLYVKETVTAVNKSLNEKDRFIILNRLNLRGEPLGKISIPKSVVKLTLLT